MICVLMIEKGAKNGAASLKRERTGNDAMSYESSCVDGRLTGLPFAVYTGTQRSNLRGDGPLHDFVNTLSVYSMYATTCFCNCS